MPSFKAMGKGAPLGEGLRVLLVDDEQMIQSMLLTELRDDGFDVDLAGNLEDAIELAATSNYDLYILDKNLPDGSGLDLAERVLGPGRDCAVIIITGHASLESAIEAIQLGVVDYLVKPFDRDGFRIRVSRVVDHLRLKREHRRVVEELNESGRVVKVLREQAALDPLTQLYNHAYFKEQFDREISRCKRHGHHLSLLFVDVDNFKGINDTLGHPTGDAVLRRIAGVLKVGAYAEEDGFRLRSHDIAARYGGDEFVVVLPETPRGGATTTAERLRRCIEELDVETQVTVSVGVASFPEDGRDAESVIRAADTALYAAKHSGRNRVWASLPAEATIGMDPSTPASADVGRLLALQRVLDQAALEFDFVPVVQALSREVYGYEAVARIEDEVFPDIKAVREAAERSGRIGAFGRTVRQGAVAAAAGLPNDHPILLHLHPLEVYDPSLRAAEPRMQSMTERIILAACRNSEVADQKRFRRALRELQERGFRIALENPPLNYDGLGLIDDLRPNFVRMPISTLGKMDVNNAEARLRRHFLDHASGENISIIATEVETRQEWDRAIAIGCQLVQGNCVIRSVPKLSTPHVAQT